MFIITGTYLTIITVLFIERIERCNEISIKNITGGINCTKMIGIVGYV